MEKIKFMIIRLGYGVCTIKSLDIRERYQKIADSACISSLDILLSELARIRSECEKIDIIPVFIFDDYM